MSLFDEIFAASAVPVLFALSGEAVTYCEPGRNPVSLQALLGAETIDDDPAPTGRNKRRIREASFDRDPDSPRGGVAQVLLSATVTLAGEEWAIGSIVQQTASLTRVRLTRPARIENTRAGYRRE